MAKQNYRCAGCGIRTDPGKYRSLVLSRREAGRAAVGGGGSAVKDAGRLRSMAVTLLRGTFLGSLPGCAPAGA